VVNADSYTNALYGEKVASERVVARRAAAGER